MAKQGVLTTFKQARRAPGRRGGATPARRVARRLVTGRWALLTVVVLALAALMIGLGFWQLGRLEERRAANAALARGLAAPPLPLTAQTARALDPAALTSRRVAARGTYDYANEVVLRYRTYNGQTGVKVLTPLRLADGDAAVLVDRGWIPYQAAEPAGRRVFQEPAGGAVEIEGLAQLSQAREGESAISGGQESAQGRADAWSRVDLAAIGRQVPYPLLPFWVERLPNGAESRPPFAAGPPEGGDGPHLSYAIQWWAFTAILLAGYLAVAHSAVNGRRRTTAPGRARR